MARNPVLREEGSQHIIDDNEDDPIKMIGSNKFDLDEFEDNNETHDGGYRELQYLAPWNKGESDDRGCGH